MTAWGKGRGLLGPLKPLLGAWANDTSGEGESPASRMPCTRCFQSMGKGWIMLDARWGQSGEGGAGEGQYRETALFGAGADGGLAMFSFTSDGKRSQGRLADGADVHAAALAFEAEMPAGLARMIYWPLDGDEPGFHFAVESRTRKGWSRFLRHTYRPAVAVVHTDLSGL